MDDTFIIMRYADGAIGLTGWGFMVLFWLAVWVGIFTSNGPGGK